jgi:7-cyano-7-deazaguanine synthase
VNPTDGTPSQHHGPSGEHGHADVASVVAVLSSGGADSAILVADLAGRGHVVQPVYVRFGLAWESVEEAHLVGFLNSLPSAAAVLPLVTLEEPAAHLYGAHWSVSGEGIPDADSPDQAVELPGRNLLLLAKASVWCALHGVQRIALGTLSGNPFPDSRREFFDAFGELVGLGLAHRLSVLTPFANLSKPEVLRRGRDLRLDLTFSCIDPQDGRHCGRCNKCAERRRAFDALSISDGTAYAARS